MRVFGWAGDDSGCGFYRLQLPLSLMAAHGYSVRGATQRRGRVALRDFQFAEQPVNVIVGQRIVLPEYTPMWRRLRAYGRLVFELDDDLFHVDPQNRRAHRVYARPSVRDTMRHCIAISDLVTVSTEPLARVVAEETDTDPDRIVVLPNRIAPSMFAVQRPRRERLTVGWAGGASHDPDMMMFYPTIRRFLDRHPHADFHLVGHDFRPLIRRPTVRLTRWSDSITAYWASVDFDIGVAPLAHSLFAASKSGLKCLEYGALGIPCVASDEPPYREVIVDGVTGFLCHSEHQWDRRLRELANDAALREQMGAAAKQHVMTHWSMADGWPDWVRAYQRLTGVARETRVA